MIRAIPRLLQRFGSSGFILGLVTIILSAYRLLYGPLYPDFNEKNIFIDKAISTGGGSPIDGAAIKNLCLNRTWTENVIFECQDPQDFGPVTTRNVILNCLRYAIEAGGAFIIPQITSPKFDRHFQEVANSQVPFTHLFDQDHFVATLGVSCPQLKIYNHTNELWELPSTANSYALTLDPAKDLFNLTTEVIPSTTIITQPSEFLPRFTKWLNKTSIVEDPELPVRIQLRSPFLQWPVKYDDPQFAAQFGKILKFREDTRRLAGSILYQMSKEYRWKLSFHNSTMGDELRYFGINLEIPSAKIVNEAEASRPEKVDLLKSNASLDWGGYEKQAEAYTAQAALSGLEVVYIAGADLEQFKNITGLLRSHNMKAVGRGDFLSTTELAEVKLLTKDQQSLIDYEVLLRCAEFAGGMASTASWNIALSRHEMVNRVPGATMKGNRADKSFSDPLNSIFGEMGILKVYEAAMWP